MIEEVPTTTWYFFTSSKRAQYSKTLFSSKPSIVLMYCAMFSGAEALIAYVCEIIRNKLCGLTWFDWFNRCTMRSAALLLCVATIILLFLMFARIWRITSVNVVVLPVP